MNPPGYCILKLSSEEIDRLGDGYSYTLQSDMQLTSNLDYVHDWGENFRIGVFNNQITDNVTYETVVIDEESMETEVREIDSTNYESLTVQEIYKHALYWSNPPLTVNEFNNIECPFMYDADYPVYIIVTNDYAESPIVTTLKFSEPCIIETNSYQHRLVNGNYPYPILKLLDTVDTSNLELSEHCQSDSFILYKLAEDEGFGTTDDVAIRGIELSGNLEQADNCVLYAKLISPNGEISQRSIIISDNTLNDDNDIDFSVGGSTDLWGFSILDFKNIRDWCIELFISNILEDTPASITLNDLQVIAYTEEVTPQKVNIRVEGEDISFYGAFIEDLVIPIGLDTDVDFLTIDGTDTNDVYRQNIREKEIEIEFNIGDTCSLEHSTTCLRQLIKLLTNNRDKYNRPIPKRIEFSHLPDLYFEYVMKDAPDITVELSTYNVKVKLIIPSGTGYAINNTITGVMGTVKGLAAINPYITITPIDTDVEVLETLTNQRFHMTYDNDWIGKIVEIDCEDMIVWLKESVDDSNPINITNSCDFNVDWFRLQGEYNFQGTNCIVRTIDFTERW